MLAAQVVRCSKLLRACAHHFEQRQLEICNYVGRGLVETTIDLRYLLRFGTPELFQRFVAHSFRSDQNLRELIEGNIEARESMVLPIEDRMLNSMERRLAQAGVSLDEIPRSARETWGDAERPRPMLPVPMIVMSMCTPPGFWGWRGMQRRPARPAL